MLAFTVTMGERLLRSFGEQSHVIVAMPTRCGKSAGKIAAGCNSE